MTDGVLFHLFLRHLGRKLAAGSLGRIYFKTPANVLCTAGATSSVVTTRTHAYILVTKPFKHLWKL